MRRMLYVVIFLCLPNAQVSNLCFLSMFYQLYPVTSSFGAPIFFSLERAAAPYFGIKVQGDVYWYLFLVLFVVTANVRSHIFGSVYTVNSSMALCCCHSLECYFYSSKHV